MYAKIVLSTQEGDTVNGYCSPEAYSVIQHNQQVHTRVFFLRAVAVRKKKITISSVGAIADLMYISLWRKPTGCIPVCVADRFVLPMRVLTVQWLFPVFASIWNYSYSISSLPERLTFGHHMLISRLLRPLLHFGPCLWQFYILLVFNIDKLLNTTKILLRRFWTEFSLRRRLLHNHCLLYMFYFSYSCLTSINTVYHKNTHQCR